MKKIQVIILLKVLANINARLLNQYRSRCQTVYSATFDKQNEDDEVLDQNELYLNLDNNRILTESDIDNIDIRSQLEPKIQTRETKDSRWRFDESSSMTI